MIRRLRLASGLVMLAYVTTHFVNHSLGLISVQAMDRALVEIYQYWASPLGGVLLRLTSGHGCGHDGGISCQ